MASSRLYQQHPEDAGGNKTTGCDQAPVFRPLTPPESPRSPDGTASSEARPGGSTYHDLQPETQDAVDQLLRSSQTTLDHTQRIVQIVSDLTYATATLGPVMRAADEIARLKVEVQLHGEARNAAIEKAKMDVRQTVEDRIAQTLRPRVVRMVAHAVEQVIGDCVQAALEGLVQRQMKDEIDRYRARILEVRTMLADAEARRRNEQHQCEARYMNMHPIGVGPFPCTHSWHHSPSGEQIEG
ncbi:hypothetical protein C8Q73DRAFT_163527 [Cubamyces lactineus]|nr:hypothetical protein C8Q73DRAFT_163527 [Cubamyces lactineus]